MSAATDALTGSAQYKAHVLDYMGAWAQRCAENGDVIPSNVALDGTVPKWWGAQQHSPAESFLQRHCDIVLAT